MGLSRASRLTRHEDFQRLYEKGRKYVHPLAVFFFARSGLGSPRIGLTVSRRLGKAVVRNRIKRRLREVWRQRVAQLPPVDIVVVARTPLAKASFSDYEEAVSRFLCWLRPKQL